MKRRTFLQTVASSTAALASLTTFGSSVSANRRHTGRSLSSFMLPHLQATLIDMYDFYGLHIELHRQLSSQDPHPHLAMSIPNTLRILGGGVTALTGGAGSLLTSSYPFSGTEWDAKAKDHAIASPGVVAVYCIAAAIPPADYLIVSNTTPSPVPHPQAIASLPAEYVLVGGGAHANWELTGGAGSLLYASRPDVGESWFAAAKDHLFANSTTVTAYAIGVRRSFLDSMGFTVVRFQANSQTPTGQPSVNCGPADERVATLIAGGAETKWTGAGSLLTASAPDIAPGGPPPARPWGWRVQGQEHVASDSTTITAWALALVKYR